MYIMYPASPGATKNKATRYRYRSRKKGGRGAGRYSLRFIHFFISSFAQL